MRAGTANTFLTIANRKSHSRSYEYFPDNREREIPQQELRMLSWQSRTRKLAAGTTNTFLTIATGKSCNRNYGYFPGKGRLCMTGHAVGDARLREINLQKTVRSTRITRTSDEGSQRTCAQQCPNKMCRHARHNLQNILWQIKIIKQ